MAAPPRRPQESPMSEAFGHREDTATSDARGRAPTDRREADPSITETDAACTSDGGDPAPTHKRREASGRG
jgi:hypothetical protein